MAWGDGGCAGPEGTLPPIKHPVASPVGGMPVTTRGRVVMLVDNDVRVDSRVQKEARSMAAAGWEIILLGERRDATLETWSIGDATVRLVPMDNKLTYAPSTWRRSWVRRAFAYPPGLETAQKMELAPTSPARYVTAPR